MPKYVLTALHKFQHRIPYKSQDAPNLWDRQTYDQTTKYANQEDTPPLFPPKKILSPENSWQLPVL